MEDLDKVLSHINKKSLEEQDFQLLLKLLGHYLLYIKLDKYKEYQSQFKRQFLI